MLAILTLGQMIPLVLNFEALFKTNHNRQNIVMGSGGWLEVNEVLVRVVTMVAFLLQFRFLQLTWSSKLGDGDQKGLLLAEKKALFVLLPLYLIGAFVASGLHWWINHNEAPWKYGTLRPTFYVGITFIHLLPHAYDLYRSHRYAPHLDASYIYANGGDFFSTEWDVIIPCGGLLFATLIYLQQRFSGCCILPSKFKQSTDYEKVPVASG
ncbi:hypothetical protein IFM89_038490 [Coptis chinensis]|uniref:RING-type E3 ubiquitin transferase n=1 Tax=Coptis chinensis TaxID=261450 RepID=A0A835IYX9_9MAGN|nr:hypothetical protein IFM89_038490 [Coptis chinensis]